jgi:hypothetical protein
MAQVTITQLPNAGALTGSESVPIVQNGQTVQTITGAIAGAGALNYPFLTVGSTVGLTQARYLAVNTGLTLTDGGVGNTYTIGMNGAAASLNAAGTGIQVKTDANTLTPRSIAVGPAMTISNADGVSGNPTISLNTLLQNFGSQTGTGILAMQAGNVGKLSILATASQTSVANGNGAGDVTIGLADNIVMPGTGSATLPQGTTVQRVSNLGAVRYNTTLQQFEGYTNVGWNQFSLTGGVTSFSAGTTGFDPTADTTGAVTLSGILNSSNGGTGVNNGTSLITVAGNFTTTGAYSMTLNASGATSVTLPTSGTLATLAGSETFTNKSISGASNSITNIANSSLVNNSVTYNGVTVALGASGTITASTTAALTVGTGLQLNSGTTFDGSVAKTISIDSTVATLSGVQTLTNKSISGIGNTFSNIPNSALTNHSITVGTTTFNLGDTSLTLAGLTSVTVTQDPTSALQLATKQYVDSVAQGLNVKAAVLVATTANITLSGEQTIDGVLTASSRVLVKNQSTQSQNGIYVSSSGSWARSADADTWNELVSAFVFVSQGTVNADTGWVCTVDPGGTLGVTAVTWAQFSGAGTYTAGTGLTLTGTQFSLTAPVTAALGGSGYTSYTTGDMLYASSSSALNKLAIGSSTYIMTSSGTGPQWSNPTGITVGTATNLAGGTAGALPYQTGAGATTFLSLGTANYVLTAGASAPQYVAQSTLSVGSATNATNTGTTADSTNANYYIVFKSATTGNLPELVNSSITVNPSTGKLTGGIAGGAF